MPIGIGQKRWVKATGYPSVVTIASPRHKRNKKRSQFIWEDVTTNISQAETEAHSHWNRTGNFTYRYQDDQNSLKIVPSQVCGIVDSWEIPSCISSPALVLHKVMKPPEIYLNSMSSSLPKSPTSKVSTEEDSEFFKLYEQMNTPILEQTLVEKYNWPPSDDIFQTCNYFDSDSTDQFSQCEKDCSSCAIQTVEEDRIFSSSIKIYNIDGETAVEDIRCEFPQACSITIKNLKAGLPQAIVQFATLQDASTAFERSQLKKIALNILDWIHMNEVAIEGVPPEITKERIKKAFPQAKKIKRRYLNGQAVVQFKTGEKAAEALSTSQLLPLGERCLKWGTSKVETEATTKCAVDEYSSEIEIISSNIQPHGGTVSDQLDDNISIRGKTFPATCNPAGTTRNSKGRHTMTMRSDPASDILTGHHDTVQLSPNELEIVNIPVHVADSDLRIRFPKHRSVNWRRHDNTAILQFDDSEEAAQAIEDSSLKQLTNRILQWSWTESCDKTSTLNGDKKTKALRKREYFRKNDIGVSNISNLFTKTIYITNFPSWFTVSKLKKMYPTAVSMEVTNWRKRKLAMVTFENTIVAAKACYATQRIRIHGKRLKASPRKPVGFKRNQKSSSIIAHEMKKIPSKVGLADI